MNRFKMILSILVIVGLAVIPVYALPPAAGNVMCNSSTARIIYNPGTNFFAAKAYKLTMVNMTSTTTIYVAPTSTVKITAGIPINQLKFLQSYTVDQIPNELWYCISSGATSRLNYIIH